MKLAEAETHRCPGCHEQKSPEEFPPRSTRGHGNWFDQTGGLRSVYCRACINAHSRQNHANRRARRSGELIVGYGLLDAEPFRRWLLKKRRLFIADMRHVPGRDGRSQCYDETVLIPPWFAEYVGVPARDLTRVLNGGAEQVRVETVERSLMHEGSTCLWELYGHLYPDDEVFPEEVA